MLTLSSRRHTVYYEMHSVSLRPLLQNVKIIKLQLYKIKRKLDVCIIA